MRSTPSLHVPSRSVLRYLKVQVDAISVYPTCNARHCKPTSGSQATNRQLSTTSRRCVSNANGKQHYAAQYPCSSPKPRRIPCRNPSISHIRHASSRTPGLQRNTRWASLWSKIRGSKSSQDSGQGGQGAGHDDTSAQLFNLSRALARSPAASDLKLRCTEFDANGSVTLISGEFKKSELIAKYGLQPRDLRKIDSSVLPHILIRPTAILINLLHLRVLIQSDRVLVFDAYGSTDSYTQSLFMYDLEGKLRQKPDPRATATYLPYEFRALEAVLISVTSGLEAEFALVRDPVTHILQELEEDIDREKLRHLLIHSKKLGTFEQKARLVRDAIDDLLEADDDLVSMYLTELKQTGKLREEDDHQEIEMLLESYHKICDEIVEISGNLISNIRNTEEVVKAILDANRNQLMLLEIKFSVGTLGLAGGTLIAGLYGMNLNNFIEETNFGFGAITISTFIISGLICVYGMRKLRKVQKVRMFGEGLIFDRGPKSAQARAMREHVERGARKSEAAEMHAWNQRFAALKQRDWSQAQSHAQLQARRQAYGSQHHHADQGPLFRQHGKPTPPTGPVMWPSMDGLGVNKLDYSSSADASDAHNHSNAGGQVDEETGHGYSEREDRSTNRTSDADQYSFRLHDDLPDVETRMKQERAKQRDATAQSGANPMVTR